MARQKRSAAFAASKNNKFTALLNQGDVQIKAQRAANILNITEQAASNFLTEKKRQIFEVERRIITLTDVSPDNTLTTTVVGSNFDAAEWFTEIVELETELALYEQELAIAEGVYQEWFGEEIEEEGE